MPDITPEYIKPYLNEDYYFDKKAADRVINFIERTCFHFKGIKAGKPFLLLEWQKRFINKIFGIKKFGTHKRRFRTAYLIIPRKNGKTTFASCILLYMLIADGVMNADTYSAAGSKDQARILYNITKQLVEASPVLSQILKVNKTEIKFEPTNSVYKVVSREGKTVHGLDCQTVFFDEAHVQSSDELYEALSTSQGARSEPLLLVMTTAGMPHTWAHEFHKYAKRIYENPELDVTFLPEIYEATDTDDWESSEVWVKNNPSIGETVSLEFLKSEYNKTKEFPSYISSFKRLYLNMWLDSDNVWIESPVWNGCVDKDIKLEDFEGEPVWMGLDLASSNDLTCLVLVFEREGEYYIFPRFYIPSHGLKQRVKKDKVPYDVWLNRNDIITTSGNGGLVVDYNYIAEDILQLAQRFEIVTIATDPWNSGAFINTLKSEGLDKITLFRQGFITMSPATKEFEKAVISKKIHHPDNQCLNWNISNVILESDAAGNVKPSKKKSAEKIDGAVAAIMAYSVCLMDSTYEEEEPEVYVL